MLSAMEVDYSGKRFNTEPEVRDMVMLVLTLDPLPNINDDDKMTRLSNKGITQETYIISSNIQAFVQRAIDEDDGFPGLKLEEQRTILIAYAQEQLQAADIANQIISENQAKMNDANTADNSNADIIGKIPLAVQQLSLAATRATDAGNLKLAAIITTKINQLLGQVVDQADGQPV